ncbi:MAG: ribonuclease J [Clostridia bacterium]|nr:ribonuclease J [Clostridia bacterium]
MGEGGGAPCGAEIKNGISGFLPDTEVINLAKKEKPKLRIIPLGGLGEIGKNMTVLEYGDDMIVIDCGLSFPDEDMLGIDLVIPDMTYLEENFDRLRGFVITHGHEDHIGAMPFALQKFSCPVFGSRFTLALIEHKLEEHRVKNADLRCVCAGDAVELGCFRVEFIKVSHSIAGALAVAVTTPVGVVIHTGDFKVDYTPIDNEPIDISRFAYYGSRGVLALMMDSTNAELPGCTPSERELGRTFENVFDSASGRVIVATFASNVYRIQQIADVAVRHGRVLCFQGRSMVMITGIARDQGILNIPEDAIVDIEQLRKYRDDEVCVFTTGSQGESMSGLFRMANANHKLNIGKGDTVVISATAIPGNEKAVGKVINQLFQRGASVVYDRLADVHVSGHARREELKLMMRVIKPKFFIPVHGEARHLYHHARLATSLGIREQNVFVLDTGSVLELSARSGKVAGAVTSGFVMVDGSGVGDIGSAVLRERRQLSTDGIFVAVISIDRSTGRLTAEPELFTRGFVYEKDSDELLNEVRGIARELSLAFEYADRSEWAGIKAAVKSGIKGCLMRRTGRQPVIHPVFIETE